MPVEGLEPPRFWRLILSQMRLPIPPHRRVQAYCSNFPPKRGGNARYTERMQPTPPYRRADFEYALPSELIAQTPSTERGASRLMVLDHSPTEPIDAQFRDIVQYVNAGDVLVRNNTRVLPARLAAKRPSGGQVELLLERIVDDDHAWVQLRQSKPVRVGQVVELTGLLSGASLPPSDAAVTATVCEQHAGLWRVRFSAPAAVVFAQLGSTPLPPYITRAAQALDAERYQTVYAQHAGAVAAPTAGLHFTSDVFAQLVARGVHIVDVTLHVGAGTFKPVLVEDLSQHHMHAEWFEVTPAAVAAITAARTRGARVIAIGTTAVRSLETAALTGSLQATAGESRLFIRPGFTFRVVDAMITNFHVSGSTLLMLVSAFAGVARIRRAYQLAIERRYRFFSYGDAMLLTPERS